MKFTSDERIVLNLMKQYAFGVIQPPKYKLKHYSVEPGLAYSNTLWDWDSYWAVYALSDICELLKGDADFDYEGTKNLIKLASKGDVLNFLDFQEEDGFVPIMLRADYENDTYAVRPNVNNANKAFLCKSALLAAKINEDFSWIETDKLIKYMDYMRRNQYDELSGLYFWRCDVMIGGDNNPTVFGRPENSSADIFLNSFMVDEYDSLIKIIKAQGGDAARFEAERDKLVNAIMRECWDEKDGLFYSQDLLSKTNETEIFNKGLGVFWRTMPLKVEFWGCYLPLMIGFATEKQAERMFSRLSSGGITCPYGIRSLSKYEKMYSLQPSGNPSNWLGAVWTICNFAVFDGYLKYGRKAEAEDLYGKTLKMLADSIKKDGSMSESYNPETGEGILHRMFFSWNMLVASMMKKMKEGK